MFEEDLVEWIDRPVSNSDIDMIKKIIKYIDNWNQLKAKIRNIANIDYMECNMESYNVYSHILKLMDEMENGQN